jgi:hypothetical protein
MYTHSLKRRESLFTLDPLEDTEMRILKITGY